MTRQVLDKDSHGKPTVVVYPETPEEKASRRRAREEQAERGREVAESLRRRPSQH